MSKVIPGRFKSKSVVLQWLFAYSLILLVLLASGILLNFFSVGAIKKETVNSKQYFLMAVSNDIRGMLEQADQMYNTIYFSRYFAPLSNAKTLDADTTFAIYSFHNELKASATMSSTALKYLVYYPELDIILSDHGGMDSETYYTYYVEGAEMTHGTYRSLLEGGTRDRYYLVNDGQYQMLCYSRATTTLEGGVKANILVLLSGNQLQGLLDRYFAYNISAIALRDSQDRTILLHSLDDSAVIEDFLQKEHSGNLFEIAGQGGLLVAYAGPLMQGWTCYLFSYGSDFWYQSVALNRLSIVVICLGMLVCAVGVGIAVTRSYAPVRRLVGQIHSIVPSSAEVGNEYQALDHALRTMHHQHSEQTQMIQVAHERLREDFALRLLHGHADDGEVLEHFFDFFPGEYFLLAAVRYENRGGMDREQLHQALLDATYSVTGAKRLLGVRDGKRSILLLNLVRADADQRWVDRLIAALSAASGALRERYGVTALLTVNPAPVACDDLAEAFKQLVNALEYKKIMRTDEIFSNKLVASFSGRAYYFPLNIEYELGKMIRQGDFEGAKKQLDVLFRINFYQEPLHLYMTRCLLYDIIGTIVKAVDPRNNPREIRLLEGIDIDLDSNDVESLERIQAEIEETMQVICRRLGQEDQKNPTLSAAKLELLERIKDHIRENLGDLSLNQESIAAAFGISVSQLARLFKESQGASVVEYINSLRIQRAKGLLVSTGSSIEEIAVACGYSGSKTLTRLFKKHEGVTPGIWRKINS